MTSSRMPSAVKKDAGDAVKSELAAARPDLKRMDSEWLLSSQWFYDYDRPVVMCEIFESYWASYGAYCGV